MNNEKYCRVGQLTTFPPPSCGQLYVIFWCAFGRSLIGYILYNRIGFNQVTWSKWSPSSFLYVRVSDSCWLDNRLDEASYTLTADVQNMYKCIFIKR